MKVSGLKGFRKEDFPEAPAWFDKVLGPLNAFMTAVSQALEGRLTTENFLAVREPLTFTTASAAASTFPLKFKNKLLGGAKPVEVRVAQIYKKSEVAMSAAWSHEWVMNGKGEIELTLHGLENSTDYVGVLIYTA
jgi:hypothetical protein